MANLTDVRDDARQEGDLVEVYLAAATKVYKGSNVAYNTAGFGVKGVDTASFSFAGVAIETVDNTGSSGEKYVRVWKEGVFDMDCASATQAWVGTKVYLVDDHLVAQAATTTSDVLVGTVVGFNSSTSVRVKIATA